MTPGYCLVGTLIDRTAEECSEVIKECMKINRFGLLHKRPGSEFNNLELLREEIKDASWMLAELDKYLQQVQNEIIT